MSKNYYDILGVSKNNTKAEISKAYKKLAVKHHPDRGGDPEKMKEINEAWDTLKNETKRNQYDQGGQNPYHRGGSNTHHHQGGFSGTFTSREEMEDFVRQHMYGGGWQRQPQRNEDVYIRVNVSLKDVYECKKQTIQYNFPGVGIEEVSFEIPKGCYDGAKIKIPNKGSHQNKSFSRSDLIVMFQITNPVNFDTNGHDILTIIKVNIIDIITGTTHIVDFVDGSKIEVKIPQGFGYHKRLRVKNRGLWRNGSIRGDLEIIVDYDIPKYNLTKKQLKTLKEIKNG